MVEMYSFLWARYTDYAKKYQLQVDTVTDFNSKVDEIQREAISLFAPFYASNERVRSLLAPFVRKQYGTSTATGAVVQPTTDVNNNTVQFYRVVSMGVTGTGNKLLYPIAETQENEIILSQLVPQRVPDLTKNKAYYINYGTAIQVYPEQAIPYVIFFLIYPPTATLAFTYSQVNGEYIQTYNSTGTTDLQWDKNASNLLLYMLLEKYGVSSRDDLLTEFAKMGIEMVLQKAA